MKEIKPEARAQDGRDRRNVRRSVGAALLLMTLFLAGDIAWRKHLQAQANAMRDLIKADLRPLNARAETLSLQLKMEGLSSFLRPEGLADASLVEAGVTGLERHRDLLAQRRQLFREIVQHEHSLLRATTTGAVAAPAVPEDQSTDAHEAVTLTALEQADVASADAIQSLFDWAEKRLVQSRRAGPSQSAPASQLQLELQAIYGRIKQTEEQDNKAVADEQAVLVANEGRLQAGVQEVLRRSKVPLLD